MKLLVFPLSFDFGYDTTIFYIEFEDGSKTVMSNVSGPIRQCQAA